MEHIEIILRCTGDPLTALSDALRLVKASDKEYVMLNFEKFKIQIRKTSDILDLAEIYRLNDIIVDLNEELEDCKRE